MTEHPIFMKAWEVCSILDDKKTQTRRIACKGTIPDGYVTSREYEPGRFRLFGAETAEICPNQYTLPPCPYGAPGDRLWLRETFRFTDVFDQDSPSRVGERCVDAGYRTPWAPLQFEADGRRMNWEHTGTPPHDGRPMPGKLRPAIHMPRWASRILLEVTAVRVDRLQDISDADARAEGVGWSDYQDQHGERMEPREAFAALWEQINGPGSWDANPWVWCVSFRRVEP